MSSKFVKNADAVADDRNWIGLIKNEEKCAEVWEKDWGFLAGGADKIKKEEATKIFTVDDRIKRLNEVNTLSKINKRPFSHFRIGARET